MGVLKMVTAKVGDFSFFDSVGANACDISVADGDYRTPDQTGLAGKAFRALGTGFNAAGYGVCAVSVASGADMYARLAFKAKTYSTNDLTLISFMEGSTSHVSITVNPGSGNVRAVRGASTVLATSASGVWSPYSWVCLEVKVKVADSGGSVEVRLNGSATAVLTFSGDTRDGSTGAINAVRLGLVKDGASGVDLLFDDIMVRDDTWCGSGGIYLLTPDSAGDSSDWTASAGDAWQCVDELPPSFNDYVYVDAATSGATSLFGVANLPVTPTQISCVGVVARVRANAPGSATVKPVAKSGTTTVLGAAVALDVGEVWAAHFMDNDPDGNVAWSGSKVNALQIGVQNV